MFVQYMRQLSLAVNAIEDLQLCIVVYDLELLSTKDSIVINKGKKN
jgi:hypothetical protein